MPTPLINSLRVQGGTLYTFTSAANDISKTFTDDDNRFVFSKFVLLDIPNVATPLNDANNIVWESIGATGNILPNSSVPLSDLSLDNNVNLAQSFQNYLLNFEQLILDGNNTLAQSYNQDQLYTVSERIFWKWLANINAIRFRNATSAESTVAGRIVEEDPSVAYTRVVKYIGDIDIVNNVSRGGHAYSEVYMNVPVTHGNTPLILFQTLADTNYSPSRIWTNGNEFIAGRDAGSIHPSGLSTNAYYDNDINNQYIASSIFGDITNFAGIASSSPSSPKPILRSRADGLIVDMDPSSYKPIADNPEISIIPEFNSTDQSADFSFNAALIYYDTYSASNPQNRGRNLYGILILDDFVNEGSGIASLKRFDKFKPNAITKLNGNGYGLKLNVKFDTSVDNVGVETIINDYNTFSMDLFIDASTRMQETADIFLEQVNEITDIRRRLSGLESFYFTQAQLTEITQRISDLERSLSNSNMAFQSSTSLLDLINQNADNLNLILSGNLSVPLTYNTDVLKTGDGILLDRSVPNEVRIINRTQKYSNFMICQNTNGFLSTSLNNGQSPNNVNIGNQILLDKFTNYFRQINQNPDPFTNIENFDDNLIINVRDKNQKWKKGQVLRFVFNDPINTMSNNIIFRTDSENEKNNGIYGITIGIITTPMLLSNKPIFEIICVDETQYIFNIDILR